MKRVGWYALAVTMLVASFLQFRDAYVGLEPLHLTHSHRNLSVTSLFGEEFPASDRVVIRDGFLIPDYRLDDGFIVAHGTSALLTDESGKTHWLKNRLEGPVTDKSENYLFVSLQEEQYRQLWPELQEDPLSVEPLQMELFGTLETWSSNLPTDDVGGTFSLQVLRLERPLAPWWLLLNFGLGCLVLWTAIIFLRCGKTNSATEPEGTKIPDPEPAC